MISGIYCFFNCAVTLCVPYLFRTVPCIGQLSLMSVLFPGHTHLNFANIYTVAHMFSIHLVDLMVRVLLFK